jgi:hypothetical protein
VTTPHVVKNTTQGVDGKPSLSESLSWGALPDFLRDRIILDPYTGCWLWTGPPNAGGHGQVCPPNGTTTTAHRAVWEFFFGPLESEIHLHHRCPSRTCCNPLHLQPRLCGSHRSAHCHERWARQKADPAQRVIGVTGRYRQVPDAVRTEIRSLYSVRAATQQELATRFGISRHTVYKIIHEARP